MCVLSISAFVLWLSISKISKYAGTPRLSLTSAITLKAATRQEAIRNIDQILYRRPEGEYLCGRSREQTVGGFVTFSVTVRWTWTDEVNLLTARGQSQRPDVYTCCAKMWLVLHIPKGTGNPIPVGKTVSVSLLRPRKALTFDIW